MLVGAMEDVTDRVDAPAHPTGDDGFRSLVVSSPLGVCYSDASGRIAYVNERWVEISGRSAAELLDTDDLRIAHPDDRDALFESMLVAARAGEEWFGEMRVLRPDGEIRHTRTSMAAIHDPDGRVSGYVGTLEDVTDEAAGRKRTESALKARVAAEALVAETSRSLVKASVDDVDEQVITVLQRLARFVGADSAVLAARRDELAAGIVRRHAWYSPELLEEQERSPERAPSADGGATQEAGTREVIGSVTLEWRSESANVDREALEPLVVVGDALVSTLARVRAERAVRSSEERFRSLAEHSSDFMCVYGETGEIMYLSPSTARFTGFGVGTSFSTPGLVHPDDIGLVTEVFGPLRAGPCGETCQPVEVRIRDAKGEYRWLEMIATNLLADPVVGGIVVNARDTTERRQARDELQRINESLERTNTQLSELIDEKLEVERQLRSSEELFRAIVQNSSDAVTLLDEDGTIRYGSGLGDKVLGYPEGFALGMDALELVHPDDQVMVAEVMAKAFTEPGT